MVEGGKQVEGRTRSLSICRLVIGVNAKNLSSDVCPKQGTKADPALSIMPKTTTGIQCRDNKQRTPEYDSGLIDEKKRDNIPHKRRSQKDGILCLTRDKTIL